MYISKIGYNMPDADEYLNADLTAYSVHQDMWSFFPGHTSMINGPFIYCVQHTRILMISSLKPVLPSPLWTLQTRTYNPIMDLGQELFYELKFSPSYTKDGKKTQYISSNLKNTNDGTSPRKEQSRELILQWFKARVDRFGFAVNSMEITSDIHRVIPKPDGPYPINEVGVTGVLTVTDTTKFIETLYHGIGRNKRNGCGLLLVS